MKLPYLRVCECMYVCMISLLVYLLLHCCLILVLLLVGFIRIILLMPNHLQATIVYCIYVYGNYSFLYHILYLLFCN